MDKKPVEEPKFNNYLARLAAEYQILPNLLKGCSPQSPTKSKYPLLSGKQVPVFRYGEKSLDTVLGVGAYVAYREQLRPWKSGLDAKHSGDFLGFNANEALRYVMHPDGTLDRYEMDLGKKTISGPQKVQSGSPEYSLFSALMNQLAQSDNKVAGFLQRMDEEAAKKVLETSAPDSSNILRVYKQGEALDSLKHPGDYLDEV